eukprot:4591894-Prymnesium_polylepis.1
MPPIVAAAGAAGDPNCGNRKKLSDCSDSRIRKQLSDCSRQFFSAGALFDVNDIVEANHRDSLQCVRVGKCE